MCMHRLPRTLTLTAGVWALGVYPGGILTPLARSAQGSEKAGTMLARRLFSYE